MTSKLSPGALHKLFRSTKPFVKHRLDSLISKPIFVGDTVVITQGKDKGKTGKVIAVRRRFDKVLVENCNTVSIIEF
jgi:hypothetical protein